MEKREMYKTGRVNSTQITNVEPPLIPGERCLQYQSEPQRYKNELYLLFKSASYRLSGLSW